MSNGQYKMSVLHRIRVWVRNPKNYVILGAVSASLVGIAKACPLLFPSHLYRPIMEAYKGGKRIQPSMSQIQEFEDVCMELGIKTDSFSTFITSQWDLKVKGLPFLPSGVQYGIPLLFVDEPVLSNTQFAENVRVNLASEEGSRFKQSLQLSVKARKFALAKGVVHAHQCFAAYPVLFAPVAVVAGFASTFTVQVIAGMFPLSVTAFFVGSAFFCTYRYLTGVLNKHHDLKSDQIVAKLGQSYVEGGIEFYEKNLQRNKALRILLGTKGEKLYSYYGNVTPGVIWSRGAALTVKRENLVQILKSLNVK
ncbi:transmembrane protein 177-like isoform X1 [Apostichopus japonicus]